ncbi:LysR family transcriptional regulator [Paenibacillus physcomitrellae]|nr:LysR family transcriptional regulator [Paenibacillus physcomitrellae]
MEQSLQVFITVAEQRNFTRAAELLHMTQPAVSSYIQTLERALGARLLDRTNKYVQLNKAGEIVYHHAKEILNLYTRMGNLLDDLQHTASGPLTIGASYTFGEYILPHVLTRLRELYPKVSPTITIANSKVILDLTARRQLDIGIVEGELKEKELTGVSADSFAEDQMFITASPRHPASGQIEISAADLAEHTWIVREEGSGTRQMQEKAFEQLGFQPAHLLVIGSTQAIKEAVDAGLGLTLLSRWTLRKELEAGSLQLLQLDGFPLTRQFSLVMPESQFQTKATELLAAMIRDGEGFPED